MIAIIFVWRLGKIETAAQLDELAAVSILIAYGAVGLDGFACRFCRDMDRDRTVRCSVSFSADIFYNKIDQKQKITFLFCLQAYHGAYRR